MTSPKPAATHGSNRRTRAARVAVYLLHTALFASAGIITGVATAPHLPPVPVIGMNTAWIAGSLAAATVCFALDPAVARVLRALSAEPAGETR